MNVADDFRLVEARDLGSGICYVASDSRSKSICYVASGFGSPSVRCCHTISREIGFDAHFRKNLPRFSRKFLRTNPLSRV